MHAHPGLPILVLAVAAATGCTAGALWTGSVRDMNLDELCRAHSYDMGGGRAVDEMHFRGYFGALDLERIRAKRIEVGMSEKAFLCATRDQTLTGAPLRPKTVDHGLRIYELAGYDYARTTVRVRDGRVVGVSQER